MLKTCWDCIFGYDGNRVPVESDDVYGTQLNGNVTRTPRWPEPQTNKEIMLLLPKKLNPGDSISFTGTMSSDPRRLSVSLLSGDNVSPDYNNVACRFVANFGDRDDTSLEIIENGNREIVDQTAPTSELFQDSSFNFKFNIKIHPYNDGIVMMNIFVNSSFVQQVSLKHNLELIRYIGIDGDVEKLENLEFNFA